jgi:hypothetical protein
MIYQTERRHIPVIFSISLFVCAKMLFRHLENLDIDGKIQWEGGD